ncbi:hypothetical protein [Micromonospora carbonacea]|uniref:Uncharacterized protein n=1 Tax=Micromonospora carbonacea TaxID=47853 RepID=A0A7H8XGW3_9ACTN|nr:hypothetical protein [Micromonospora carbonacea]MBB5828469.1 hypothetical protein [Micromonospora carbonacea]QLD23930.1 hypothetical protein HXZ27_06630 [Micromonospora carbonacea]
MALTARMSPASRADRVRQATPHAGHDVGPARPGGDAVRGRHFRVLARG